MPAATLPELDTLHTVLAQGGEWLHVREHAVPHEGGAPLSLYEIALGNGAPEVPAVGFFGGVHGLERIGARVVIEYLRSLVMRLSWDDSLHRLLEQVRIVFMPVVNPGGMLRGTRANPAGVDLMRNAPLQARERVAPLVGGQRLWSGLPWYRGRADAAMEPESAALCELVERELLGRPFALALDCHSGFGMRDRLWFPYAHRRGPIPHLDALHALHRIFENSHGHHPYLVEPQSAQYLTHGDLWDHLYLRACAAGQGTFLPLTLEMGSWLWVRKNPRQLFSRAGIFNPLVAHREHRVLRRHFPLLDFLVRACASSHRWLPQGEAREAHRQAGLQRWWGGKPA
ncbi:M14 family zinc carboxypeptidase [Ramlibacter rhizophilus]|uniref:Zinc carboxypeptidase n=1 Tax=Ramlibacter rhizophilus TaxID=1781167 RepID=A0A4Z0BT43_9BURK|nr:M14 family zinc carboxypeptidase [Ramlibacter rhizophilus]TFZ01634.1 zinc carboxypeptidase [Ramlibacter rhizophilus]